MSETRPWTNVLADPVKDGREHSSASITCLDLGAVLHDSSAGRFDLCSSFSLSLDRVIAANGCAVDPLAVRDAAGLLPINRIAVSVARHALCTRRHPIENNEQPYASGELFNAVACYDIFLAQTYNVLFKNVWPSDWSLIESFSAGAPKH
nr:hypothetical protein CFP56_12899 [Quercus suber]